MPTQLTIARDGIISDQVHLVAQEESVQPEQVRSELAAGRLVIPANRLHWKVGLRPIGIGRLLRTKVNANIGTSPERSDIQQELAKLKLALEAGADTIMDLSTGGDLDRIREQLIQACPVPFGTVPIYQAIQDRSVEEVTVDWILEVIERQARQGVDFFTLHAGVLREYLPLVERRVAGIVSRGGALLAKWMMYHRRQNPLYEHFDQTCAILAQYDVCISLGDGLRPGATADATDQAQLAELRTLSELVHRAWEHGCQVMVEGPGHVPFNQIQYNMELQQQLCHGAPFYVLGPLVTDIAPGYDHITAAIGGTAAAYYGASFLCYVTPMEHLGLPTAELVRAGVITARIAAHAADLARGLPYAIEADRRISMARGQLDWQAHLSSAIDPQKAIAMYQQACQDSRSLAAGSKDFCTMCGEDWCSLRINKQIRQIGNNLGLDCIQTHKTNRYKDQ